MQKSLAVRCRICFSGDLIVVGSRSAVSIHEAASSKLNHIVLLRFVNQTG